MTDRSQCLARRHGTMSAYSRYGCRCDDAREAKRLYWKRRTHGRPEVRMLDATGTVRRIRALIVLGHPYRVIAEAAGMTVPEVRRVSYHRHPHVYKATADRVARAFDALVGSPPDLNDRWVKRTRTEAARKGWVDGPFAWDDIDDPAEEPQRGSALCRGVDEVAVARWLQGEPIRLTAVEKREAARRLHRRGVSKQEIQRRLRCSWGVLRDALEAA